MRRSDLQVIRSARPRAAYCLIGWMAACVALLLAIYLLAGTLLAMVSAENRLGDKTAGSIVMLSAINQDSGQFRLLSAGLNAAGFQVIDRKLPAERTAAARQDLQNAVSQLAGSSQGVWLAAAGSGAAEAWHLAVQLDDIAGIILVSPDNLNSLTDDDLRQWPTTRDTVIFTAADSGSDSGSRIFFEKLTGEDTTLFPPYQAGAAGPLQYAASDGRTWLMIYPGLTSEWSLLSMRLLPDITGWLDDWTSSMSSGVPSGGHAAARLLITVILQLLLAGVLLLAVPYALNLAMLGTPILIPHPEDPEKLPRQYAGLHQLGIILLWLPAMVAAAAIGMAVAWLAGRLNDWLLPALLLLPGCRGWFIIIGRLINRRWHENRSPGSGLIDADEEQPALRQKMLPSRYLGLIMVLMVLVCAAAWIWLVFGSLKPSGWPVYVLPILIFAGWPAGLAGSPGQIGVALDIGISPAGHWYLSIGQHLPFIICAVTATVVAGWPGLAAGLLLLVVDLWSVSMGKAVTLLTCRPRLGSLIQALAWSTAILLPIIANGLIRG